MVYCTKCGTKNEEDATLCVKCKEPLNVSQTVRRERRQKENECFGLPNGGAIAGLVIGLIIVLWESLLFSIWTLEVTCGLS